jgi:hypothetical protein
MRNDHKIMVVNVKRNYSGSSRRRCEDNIKMCLKISACECVEWFHLLHVMSHWRAVNTIMKCLVP